MDNQGEYNFQKPGKKAEELIPQTISIDQQISFISSIRVQKLVNRFEAEILKSVQENLISIKRWNQNPLWEQLDIEKVIKDLLNTCVGLSGELSKQTAIKDMPESVQNAEAALGMLQAFKEKRDKLLYIGTPLIRKYPLTKNDVNSAHGFTEGSEL